LRNDIQTISKAKIIIIIIIIIIASFLWFKLSQVNPFSTSFRCGLFIFLILSQANQPQMAQKIFNEMKSEESKPNICTYTALINAFAREGLCHKAEQIFEELQESGIEPDVYVYNALMEAYR
jgi:pentatricopeptide repeat protein